MLKNAEGIYLSLVRRASRSWVISLFLSPLVLLSWFFLGTVALRRALLLGRARARTVRTPIISIGNITVGGTGKTPFIALLLSHLPRDIGLVTRGYRRQAKGLYCTKGGTCTPQSGGDEASLIGRRFPSSTIAVADCKWEAVQAIDGTCEAILLDDGLQRYDIPQYIRIATVDSACPDGYGWLLPRGLCREPFSSLRYVDYIVITNADASLPGLRNRLQQFSHPIIVTVPVIQAFFSPDMRMRELVRGQNVALFSGIAHPERFRGSVEKMGLHVVDHLIVPDHGDINDTELCRFAENVRSRFPDAILVGTEKDWARRERWPDINLCFSRMELEVVEGHEAFSALILQIASAKVLSQNSRQALS